MSALLDRDSFREAVFRRDGRRCVICGGGPPLDAHHVIERRLFDDGGYRLENGASVCASCHLRAERTEIPCGEIRRAAGIVGVLLPDHLDPDFEYDKWGNVVNPDGTRNPGELFLDESVRKVLSWLAEGTFRHRIKYPKTFHLPWSPGLTVGDRTLSSTSMFEGRQIVVTEKMDGENTTMYRDYLHARSVDESGHESRGWVKRLHGEVSHDIPRGWRVCGENMFARHSISYDDLPSYFLAFSVWDQDNRCVSWDDTLEYVGLLGLSTVPVLHRGVWDENLVRELGRSIDPRKQEGLVVRLAGSFPQSAFRKSVAKWVREGHVQTTHWRARAVVRNGLRERA